MADSYPAVLAFAGVTEAAMSLGHRTYSGTVAATERRTGSVERFTSVSQAALSLGHRTYSGTVAATERRS
jgi:hypothetical protein